MTNSAVTDKETFKLDADLNELTPPRWLSGTALLTLSLAVIPFGYLLVRATSNGFSAVLDVVFRTRTVETFFNTLFLALFVGLLALVLGTVSAWIIQRTDIYFPRYFLVLATLPLAIPSYVLTYTWIALIPSFSGFFAAVLILTLTTTPYVTLAALAVLRRIDNNQEESARALGFSTAAVARKIIWPQARPTILASLLLVVLYVFSDFGAVSLLRVDTFTRVIHTMYKASFDRTAAAVIAIALVLLAVLIIWLERKLRGRQVSSRTGLGTAKQVPVIKIGQYKWAAMLFLGLLAVGSIGVPIWTLLTRFFANDVVIDSASLVSSTLATLVASFSGAVVAMSLALPLGVLLARYQSKISRVSEFSILLTHALPGVVIGLALVAIGSKIPVLYQSLPLLAFSYAVLFLAKAVGSIRTSVARVPKVLDDVSRSLGLTNLETLKRITLPLAAPGVLTGFLLVLLTAMKELPATLMLRPTGYETLATEIWAATNISRYSEAAPYALVLIVIAAIPTYLLSRPDRAGSADTQENMSL